MVGIWSRLSPKLKSCSSLQLLAKRGYIVPSYEHLVKDRGLPGVFGPQGLNNAWFDRISMYTEELNKLSSDSANEERSIETLINEYSKHYSNRDVARYASMIYNLKFAMSSLRASEHANIPTRKLQSLVEMPIDTSLNYHNEPNEVTNGKLYNGIIASFGSVIEFRSLLLNSNNAINGDGYTWLVARKYQPPLTDNYSSTTELKYDKLFILNTYNAGTPFNSNNAGYMDELSEQLSKELKTTKVEAAETAENEERVDGKLQESLQGSENLSKSINKASYNKDVTYIPLLAIDASPKCWLHDYGVFGKQQYLNNVWESIDWNSVESKLPELVQIYYGFS